MPVKILLPALSPTMTEGTLAKWLKKEGETVSSGDILAEVETDKATMEIEAVDEGKLGRILIAEGTEGVPINTPIGLILEEGEKESTLEGALNEATPPAMVTTEKVEVVKRTETEKLTPQTELSRESKLPTSEETKKNVRVFASPLAKRMAEQAGLDLSKIAGSGPKGRVIKVDIESTLLARKESDNKVAESKQDFPVQVLSAESSASIPNTNMRKIIASRLTESKQTIPHFYLSVDCEIDSLLEIRSELNSRSDEYKISINDFIIRASALSLRKVPKVNASWTDAATVFYKSVDISIAVSIEDGLITPIIFNADAKGLGEISKEMSILAQRAREGLLKPEEYQGGSFSISNLGMYGIKEFSAVINPPQSAILAVGVAEQRPIVKNGALAIGTVLSCTLSCDHRVVDGALGAEWLTVFKDFVEDPLKMLL